MARAITKRRVAHPCYSSEHVLEPSDVDDGNIEATYDDGGGGSCWPADDATWSKTANHFLAVYQEHRSRDSSPAVHIPKDVPLLS